MRAERIDERRRRSLEGHRLWPVLADTVIVFACQDVALRCTVLPIIASCAGVNCAAIACTVGEPAARSALVVTE